MTFVRPNAGPLEQGTAAYPVQAPVTGPDGSLRYSDLVYSCEQGYRPLFLDLRLPAGASGGSHPLIVWIHGGGYVHGSRQRQAPNIDAHDVIGRLLSAGYAVALVDYRLSREAAFPAPVLDVRAAVRWLRAQADHLGLDPGRVALRGESAGAHLALIAAGRQISSRMPVRPKSRAHRIQAGASVDRCGT